MTATNRRRRWSWVLGVLVLLLIALLALAWWFPARWAWQLVRADYPLVRIGQVSGSVWDGQADGLVVRGQPLGTFDWSLGRAAVFGKLHLHVDLHGAGVMVNGHITRHADGAIVVKDAHFNVPMSRLKVLWPTGMRLAGSVRGSVTQATLVEGWPTQLDARVRWHDAAVVAQGRTLALGDYLSHWQAQGGTVVTAKLHDDGTGPVRVRGTFTAMTLGWRLSATLTPRRQVAGLRQWLSRIGKPMADGSVRIERKGGLMAGQTW